MGTFNAYCVIALFITSFLTLGGRCAANLCPNVTGCRCSSNRKVPGTLYARCSGEDPWLDGLPGKNISQLTITGANFTNVSSLTALGNLDLSYILSIRASDLPEFDWNWLPDTARKFSLSLSSISRPQPFPPFNGTCNIRSSLKISYFYTFNIPYTSIPTCLPDTLVTLSFNNAPLTDLQRIESNSTGTTRPPIYWPSRLNLLSFKYMGITAIQEDVFRHAPPGLERVTISQCKEPLLRLPSNWPRSGELRILYVNNCHVNETRPSDFRFLQKLTFLNLYGNDLTRVPEGLPRSLRSILLSNNAIRYVNPNVWQGLDNLTALTMEFNQLTSVPLDMPQNLVRLTLRRNQIEFADRQAFVHMTKLERVDLSHNKLLNMPENLPHTMQFLNLQNNEIVLIRSPANYEFCFNCTMYLSSNPWVCDQNMIRMLLWASQNPVDLVLLDECGDPIPDDLGSVGITDIMNYITSIGNSVEFSQCQYHIKSLACTNAMLTTVPPKAPKALTKVTITYNANLTFIPDNHFIEQNKLIQLDLDGNAITQFPKGLPSSLEVLSLTNNKIAMLTSDIQPTLNRLTKLQQLYLDNNQITTLFDYQLKPLTSIYWLALDGNPLHCDCSMQSLSVWFEKTIPQGGATQHFLPFCATPADYNGVPITQLGGAYTYHYNCEPALCYWGQGYGVLNCSRPTQLEREDTALIPEKFNPVIQPTIPYNIYWIVVDFSHLSLDENTIELTQLPQLKTLNLTGNKLKTIPVKQLPPSIEELILLSNKITDIPEILDRYLPNLKLLDLRFNDIRSIQIGGITAFPLVEQVFLQENPLTCNCHIRPLMAYVQSQKGNIQVVQLNKLENLTCVEPPKLQGVQLFDLIEDDYCPVVIWTEITGGVVGGVIFLLVVAIIINVILYKQRRRKERKDIVQGFRKLLEQEAFLNNEDTETLVNGGTDYQYDAFVSYCSNGIDEDFVYQMIQELEDVRGRKLCIHERDFTPGRGIADNIVKCIGLSRRVIIIVSRKYSTSAWCQYEVQVTLAELHKHRRGRLLVPVLLEDVTQDENYAGSVKTILSLITGLHIPSPQEGVAGWKSFWDKLEGTLPDRAINRGISTVTYEVD